MVIQTPEHQTAQTDIPSSPVVGVLALQGAVEPHRPHIEAAGGSFRKVRTAEQIRNCDALIIPGGESTTMLKLIDRFGLEDPLQDIFKSRPVWGICAGSILMAQNVTNPVQKSYGLLPIDIERNAYGRQIDSHYDDVKGYQVCYIRAPVITGIHDHEDSEILATHEADPVWIRNGRHMATTFHPELNTNHPSPMHVYFLEHLVSGSLKSHETAAAPE